MPFNFRVYISTIKRQTSFSCIF